MNENQYEALEDMFISEGWKIFIEDISVSENSLTQSAPTAAETSDQWHMLRGRILQLRNILGYENVVKASMEQEKEEAKMAREDAVNVDIV